MNYLGFGGNPPEPPNDANSASCPPSKCLVPDYEMYKIHRQGQPPPKKEQVSREGGVLPCLRAYCQKQAICRLQFKSAGEPAPSLGHERLLQPLP